MTVAWTNLALVTDRNNCGLYQVRVSCEGSSAILVQQILKHIETCLDNRYGNYTGEEYAILAKLQKSRSVDMNSIG